MPELKKLDFKNPAVAMALSILSKQLEVSRDIFGRVHVIKISTGEDKILSPEDEDKLARDIESRTQAKPVTVQQTLAAQKPVAVIKNPTTIARKVATKMVEDEETKKKKMKGILILGAVVGTMGTLAVAGLYYKAKFWKKVLSKK